MRLSDLNYQHLRYFHAVAREGSVLRASRTLHLAPSTVSGQIKTLEEQLGQPLFRRAGRSLVLTPFGHTILRYADEIFEIGEALVRTITSGDLRRSLRIGASSVLPKLLVREVLGPAFRDEVQVHVEEGTAEDLLGALAARRLDVVLSDSEMPGWMTARGVSHLVVDTGIAVFGSPRLAAVVGGDLPMGLTRVPWLVPPLGTSLRQGLEAWWEQVGIVPDIAAVIDDSALLKALGDAGHGIFAAPERMRESIVTSYQVDCIGVTGAVRERVYAITREHEPTDAGIRAICGLSPRAVATD